MANSPVALGGEWTISQAAALHVQLLEAIANGQWRWDLSAVTECDSAGVQLLLAARRSAQSQGASLTIEATSPAVRSSLQRVGLDHLLTA